MASTQWEEIVRLAKEVEADCSRGSVDAERVARLARGVVEFQRNLVTVRHPHSEAHAHLDASAHPDGHVHAAKEPPSDGG